MAAKQVHPTACIDPGAKIGRGTQVWHFSHIMPGARIGKDCILGQGVFVGRDVSIGDRVKIQNQVSVYEGVTLENDVFCGPGATFTNVRDPRSSFPKKRGEYEKTFVRRGASIGANATIVCGTRIGRSAFVAAGAVVTRNVPDFAVVAGVPARRIGWMCVCGESLKFRASRAACTRCDRRFRKARDVVSPI